MKPMEVKGSMESLIGKEKKVQEMGKVLKCCLLYFKQRVCHDRLPIIEYFITLCKSLLLYEESLVSK